MLNRWLGTAIRFSLLALATVTLSACSGGGGGGTGSGGFLGESNDPGVLTLTSTNTAGETDNQLSAQNPLTLTVKLTEPDGSAIADAVITLSSDVSDISPDNNSALTDSNGVATFELTFNGTVGAGTVTASYTGETSSGSNSTVDASISIEAISVDIAPAFLLELATTNSDGDPAKRFSSEAPLTVTATLYGVDGADLTPLADEQILLTSSIGSVTPENGATLTNAQGVATFLLNADDTGGAGSIEVSYTPTDEEAIVRTQNIEIVPADIDVTNFNLTLQLLNASGSPTTQLDGDNAITARATLTSSESGSQTETPEPNRIISLTSDVAAVVPANGKALTNSSGVAEFQLLFDDVIGAGTAVASFNTETVSVSDSAPLQTIAPELNTALAITTFNDAGARDNILNTNQDSALVINVSLTDANGTLLANEDGELISLSSTIGDIIPNNGNALTDGGTAEFTLTFNGDVGAGVVTASYDTASGTIQQTANIEITSGEDNFLLTMVRTPATGALSAGNDITVEVTLREGGPNGAVVEGEIITLTSEISNISPSNGSAITDINGVATFTLIDDGTSDGAGVVEASYTSAANNTYTNSLNVTATQP